MKPEYIWFLIGIVLLIMELATPGLIVMFFGLGAIIVGIVCLVTTITLNMQLMIFLGASLLSLVLLRKWVKGIFMGRTSGMRELNEDLTEVVGQKVIVKEKIVRNIGGKVELHGTNWNAIADEEIQAGEVVEITGKESLTLKVKKLK